MSSPVVLTGDANKKKKNIVNRTVRRLTSWLFTQRGRGVELVTPEKEIHIAVGFEPGDADFKSSAIKHAVTMSPLSPSSPLISNS